MTLRTVTRQHHGDRIVTSVPTQDHRIYGRDLGTTQQRARRSSDSTLAAVPVGHILDQGIVWSGDLEGRAVRALDEVTQLRTPISDPGIDSNTRLDAEGPGALIDMGTVYDGLSRAARGDQEGGLSQIERAVSDAKRRKATSDSANWGERAVARSRQAQEDACSRMRDAAEKLWGTGATTDAAARAVKSGPMTNEEINKLNRDFWAEQAK